MKQNNKSIVVNKPPQKQKKKRASAYIYSAAIFFFFDKVQLQYIYTDTSITSTSKNSLDYVKEFLIMWMRPTNAGLLVFLTSGSQEFDNWAGISQHTDP